MTKFKNKNNTVRNKNDTYFIVVNALYFRIFSDKRIINNEKD